MERARSFCPGVRFGWHLSELDRCFFDDVGVVDNIPQKEYNKKGVWCMFEVDFYRLLNGG